MGVNFDAIFNQTW